MAVVPDWIQSIKSQAPAFISLLLMVDALQPVHVPATMPFPGGFCGGYYIIMNKGPRGPSFLPPHKDTATGAVHADGNSKLTVWLHPGLRLPSFKSYCLDATRRAVLAAVAQSSMMRATGLIFAALNTLGKARHPVCGVGKDSLSQRKAVIILNIPDKQIFSSFLSLRSLVCHKNSLTWEWHLGIFFFK